MRYQQQNNLAQLIQHELSTLTGIPLDALADLPSSQNLLEFVDSFSFANLLMQVEQRLGIAFDLADVNIAELTQLDTLLHFLAQHEQHEEVMVI